MNKEHIFTIAVSIDEDGIKKRALESCANDIKKSIHQCFFEGYGGYPSRATPTSEMKEAMGNYIAAFLAKHEDEIVEAAIRNVTEKVYRSKVFKEKMQVVL